MSEWWDNPTSQVTGGGLNLPATNELPVDMHTKQMTAFPQLTPVTAILTRLSEDKSHNFRIDWQEQNKIPTTVVVAEAFTNSATPLAIVANAKTLVKDTILYNPETYEAVIVTATPSTDVACVVTRAQGGTSAAAMTMGQVLHVLPPALAENDETYRTVSVSDSNVYNYQQLVKLQYAITRVMNDTSTHFGGPGSKREQLKKQKYYEARVKYEKLLYFGGRSTSGDNDDSERRMAGGFTHFLRTGTLFKDFNGQITETGFDNWLGDYADQNPDSKNVMFFCSGNIKRRMSYWGRDKLQLSPDSNKYGFRLDTYVGGSKDVTVVPLPLLTDPATRGWGFMLDLERIMLKTQSKMTFFPEAKNVGQSEKIIDTYRVVSSLMVANESRHAMCVGGLV